MGSQVFALSEEQVRHIHAIEQESFANFCRLAGVAPEEHERTLLAGCKKEFMLMFRALRLTKLSQEQAESVGRRIPDFQALAEATDYWTFKRLHTRLEHARIVGMICVLHSDLPINYTYLEKVCRSLGLAVPIPDNPDLLHAFLSSVPTLYLYEPIFNAFVEGRTSVGSIACVAIYEQLISAVEFFLDVLLELVVRLPETGPNQGILTLTIESECLSRAGSRKFRRALSETIEMALGKRASAWLGIRQRFSYSSPLRQHLFRVAAAGSLDFVWYHEFGHLLSGHLGRPHSWSVELEADMFAWKILADKKNESTMRLLYCLGGLVTTLMIEIIEAIQARGKSPTHPPARERQQALLAATDERLAYYLIATLNRIRKIVRPLLKEKHAAEFAE